MGIDLGVMLTRPLPAEGRTIEAITGEILELKKTAGDAIIGIGQRLVEAKGVLTHGEWLPWLTEQVEFSERAAQRFMRLAKEWSNPTTLSDLGASKALYLLALPPEERDSFLTEAHQVDGEEKTVIDMSARELEKAIRERKAALEAKEMAEAEAQAAEAAREKMEQEARLAQSRIDTLTEESGRHLDTLEALRHELEELKARPIDITATNVPDASALEDARQAGAAEAAKTARKEAEAKLKEKLDRAAQAKIASEEALQAAQAELSSLRARAERLEKQVKVSGSKELATASVCVDTISEGFNKFLGCLQMLSLAGNAEEHNKLVDAMTGILGALADRIPKKLEVGAS